MAKKLNPINGKTLILQYKLIKETLIYSLSAREMQKRYRKTVLFPFFHDHTKKTFSLYNSCWTQIMDYMLRVKMTEVKSQISRKV